MALINNGQFIAIGWDNRVIVSYYKITVYVYTSQSSMENSHPPIDIRDYYVDITEDIPYIEEDRIAFSQALLLTLPDFANAQVV